MIINSCANEHGEYREYIVLNRVEQEGWYSACIQRVLNDTRYVLDHLDNFPEFQVNWEDYHKKDYYKKYHKRKKDENKNKIR